MPAGKDAAVTCSKPFRNRYRKVYHETIEKQASGLESPGNTDPTQIGTLRVPAHPIVQHVVNNSSFVIIFPFAISHAVQRFAPGPGFAPRPPIPRSPAPPDFAALAVRIGRALGREAEAIHALRVAEADKSAFCLEKDPVGFALLGFLREAKTFTGTAAELLPKIIEVDRELEGRLSAKRLGRR